jgi:Protein of unknown function (DUF1800)
MQQPFPPDEADGIAAPAFLANHPATHRFIATKLVRHFVADDPPADAVRSIEAVLRETDCNLGAASAALIRLDSAWQPGTKLRSPMDFVIASVRALDVAPEQIPNLVGIPRGLGQPLWTAPPPNGWPARRDRTPSTRTAGWIAGPRRILWPASRVGGTARNVSSERGPGGPCRCWTVPCAQPFRCARLPGVRRRPSYDKRLAPSRGSGPAAGDARVAGSGSPRSASSGRRRFRSAFVAWAGTGGQLGTTRVFAAITGSLRDDRRP